MRRDIEETFGRSLDAKDSAIAATAFACCRILEHDEAAATSAIAEHVARYPLADAQGEARLRRNLAIAYVCNEVAREFWDEADLGPMHRRARALARHLIAAREGRLDRHAELGSPAIAVTILPLAWSVELAIRAAAAGCPDGGPLAPNARGVDARADPS